MIVNNHRKHSSFAIENFLAGGCSTYDGAYCLLYAQREQIIMDVSAGDAAVLKQRADILELKLEIKKYKEDFNEAIDEDEKTIAEINLLRKEAELIRLEAALENFNLNYKGAQRELDELNVALERLKPLCKYWNEDILQMEQDMQRDEWTGELKNRVENMLLSQTLGIPYDHLATMRQHPDFFEKILPHIALVNNKIMDVKNNRSLEPLKELTAPLLPKDILLITDESKAN